MLSKSIELSDANPLKAPTWRASCRYFTTDSLSLGYPRQFFELQRMLKLDGERKDSRFILVRALDHDQVVAFTSSRR
jgi:hypothetical protein